MQYQWNLSTFDRIAKVASPSGRVKTLSRIELKEKCTIEQKRYIENLRLKLHLGYLDMLKKYSEMFEREVKDIGRFTKREAGLIIKDMLRKNNSIENYE